MIKDYIWGPLYANLKFLTPSEDLRLPKMDLSSKTRHLAYLLDLEAPDWLQLERTHDGRQPCTWNLDKSAAAKSDPSNLILKEQNKYGPTPTNS